jgi:hypothetical protein
MLKYAHKGQNFSIRIIMHVDFYSDFVPVPNFSIGVPIIAKHFFSKIEQLEIGDDGEALIRARLTTSMGLLGMGLGAS